jgi:phage terminase large subunit-like protein
LADLQAWRPEVGHPVKVEDVEKEVIELHQRLGLAAVAFDPWQAQYLAERLRKRGIRTVEVDFTTANLKAMASETLEAFRERNVEIYGDDELIGDLQKLQIAERSYGYRLESPRTNEGHGDRATALAIGLFAAKRYATVAAGVKRQIRCYTQADIK